MIQLDLSDHRPLYEQIKEKMKELIIAEILKPDDKIPSVREMAQQLTINPNTIQRAYRNLETEGYIYSVRAKGSFVAPVSRVHEKTESTELTDEMENLVKRARFLGIKKETLIDLIDGVYEKKEE